MRYATFVALERPIENSFIKTVEDEHHLPKYLSSAQLQGYCLNSVIFIS